jgi:tetratricopeptide (TPR) repeat protein
LTLPPTATALLDELEDAQARASQFADALDALRDESGPRAVLQNSPRAPRADLCLGSGDTGVLPVLSLLGDTGETPVHPHPTPPSGVNRLTLPTETSGSVGDAQASRLCNQDTDPPTLSATQRAAQVFVAAEECRKRREFERAAELYTEAIEIDPRFGPAYSRRGHVRLAQKAVAAAITDFDAALARDDTAVEAWCWRGDAHAISGMFNEAIADYTRALALRPDLERVRANLAVVVSRKTETVAALAPVSSTKSAPKLPTIPASPTPPPSPAPETKKTGGQLVVNCPHCGEVGEVPWNRLGKVFACKACDRRFGVNSDGKAVELTEAPGGKWVEAGKARETKRSRRNRRLVVAATVLCAVFLPAIGYAGWLAVQPAATPGELALPQALESRAELFARGWLTSDVRLMKRLTTPTHDKVLYSWYSRHRPPLGLRGSTSSAADGARIEVTVQPGKTGQANVRVRVTNPTSSPPQSPVELTLLWEERPDGWFFVPPAK